MTRRRKLLLLLAFPLLAATAGAVVFKDEIIPERSPAGRGRLVAERAGCFSCHGFAPGSPVGNPLVAAAGAAADAESRRLATHPLAERVHGMFDDDPDEVREWVEKGSRPRAEEDDHQALRMPAFDGRLSASEIDDLVAFIVLEGDAKRARRAAAQAATATAVPAETVPAATPAKDLPWPALMARGEALARGLACFTCHGELGQGGVPNPASLKGYVPGFFGRDFDALTLRGDPARVRAWIVQGIPKELLEQSFLGLRPARWFLERQAIRMPAYEPFLRDGEADLLVAYVQALRALGPLDAAGVKDLRKRMKGSER